MQNLLQSMKKIALNAVEESKPTKIVFGTITTLSPLTIRVEQKLTLEADHIVLVSDLGVYIQGERVVLIQMQGGQKYVLMPKPSSGGGGGEVDWADILNKPSTFPPSTHTHAELHTHSNKSVLDSITQSLVNSWTEAYNHVSDAIRHITAAERTLWNTVSAKVDKVTGKGLSTEDYTTEEKSKLAGIEDGANNYTHPATHSMDILTETESKKIMTDAERAKLSGIEAGAQVNTVASVAGKTGTVVLAKADVGLSNVDNSADLDKPISSAVQTALDGKSDTSHNHAGVYEPVFTKNTAFNKNFGTAAGTVCQGNDSRLSDARIPTAHTHVKADVTDFSHTHAVGDLPVATDGESNSAKIVRADDSRLSNARTPTSHTHAPADINTDSGNRFVTDAEKATWNVKSNLALGETSTTAYRGDRGKTAYDHSQTAHAPADAISKTNVTAYTPTADYHPATKKYVDDAILAADNPVLSGTALPTAAVGYRGKFFILLDDANGDSFYVCLRLNSAYAWKEIPFLGRPFTHGELAGS